MCFKCNVYMRDFEGLVLKKKNVNYNGRIINIITSDTVTLQWTVRLSSSNVGWERGQWWHSEGTDGILLPGRKQNERDEDPRLQTSVLKTAYTA